jgi:CRISPR-associated endonuclease/helicase Cas3
VLLRSLQQWSGRGAISIPAELRALLEATYAEPAAEPAAWRQLRAELEKTKQSLADRALSATRVWTLPALPDEEDIQTRHSTYPTAGLLLVRAVERLDAQARMVRLHLVDGTEVRAGDWEWNFDAAKAIHRNLARVPRWAVSTALNNPPGWLTIHVQQPTAVGLLHPDGGIRWPGSEIETGLSYHADQGVIIRRVASARRPREEFDESYD